LKRLLLFAAFAVLGISVAGCHDETNTPPSSQPNNPPPTVGQASSSPTPVTAPAKVVVYVINPKGTGDADLLRPQEITIRHPREPARDAVTALLDSDYSPMALGTSLRGLSIDGGVATVDFSQSPFKENRGEDAESAALNALAMTLGQFPEITSYQVEVKGQSVRTFGEFTTDGPMDVIRPGAPLEAKGSGQ
jgi:spore germination protein GerM